MGAVLSNVGADDCYHKAVSVRRDSYERGRESYERCRYELCGDWRDRLGGGGSQAAGVARGGLSMFHSAFFGRGPRFNLLLRRPRGDPQPCGGVRRLVGWWCLIRSRDPWLKPLQIRGWIQGPRLLAACFPLIEQSTLDEWGTVDYRLVWRERPRSCLINPCAPRKASLMG